jgi:hypothetical protein
MHAFRSLSARCLRISCAVGFLLALSAATASAQQTNGVTVQIANPAPGASLPASPLQMQGTAKAASGTADNGGVDAVQVFLGDRDSGGTLLANAQLDVTGTWMATVDLSTYNGPETLVVYAYTAQDNQEGSSSVPVTIGSFG